MYSDGNHPRQVARQRWRRLPLGRQTVVRFVEHDPVRPSRLRAYLGKLRQKLAEKPRSLGRINSQQIDDGILFRLCQQLDGLANARHLSGIAENDRVSKFAIIAFRVDHTELISKISHLLEK